MKKQLFLTFIFLVGALWQMAAEEHVIILRTNKAIGSQIIFSITNSNNAEVKIDRGSGDPSSFETNGKVTCMPILAGDEIKIYGNGITAINVSGLELNALDVSKSPNIKSINCKENLLETLDLSKNTGLLELWCSENKLVSLDMSGNPELLTLSCYSNEITQLNLTANKKLDQLDCQSNENLKNLDVSNNTELSLLNCSTNGLSALDVSKNTKLTSLRCFSNSLSVLDVSNNSDLNTLECSRNNLNFATLPVGSFGIYKYGNQAPIKINDVTVGETIDLSSQKVVGSTSTTYQWLTEDDDYLKNGVDYSVDQGVTTFLKAPNQKVYCMMTNSALSEVALKTSLITVNESLLNGPKITLTTDKVIDETIYFDLSTTDGSDVTIDYGDGNYTTHDITTGKTSVSAKVKGSTIIIYGKNIKNFGCSSQKITNIDVSEISTLYMFHCNDNKLSSLDISKNNELIALICGNNQFDFNSLPSKEILRTNTQYYTYSYTPQAPISIVESVETNEQLDLSEHKSVDGAATVYTWKTASGIELVEGTDYSINEGVTTFLKPQTEKVHCEMTNTEFPDLTLETGSVSVSAATSIGDLEADNIKLYNDRQTVYISTENPGKYQVYDLSGRKVKTGLLKAGHNSFYLFENGIYVVHLNINNKVYTCKLSIR